MAKQAINTIKNWFTTGKFPTQQQFWDWLDSFRHKDDKVLAADVDGLQTLLDTKVDKKDIAAPEVWDELQAYVFDTEVQQYVSYQNPASEDPQFQVEGFYRLLDDTAAGESPETHPLKWAYQGFTLGEITINDVLGLQEELTSLQNQISEGSGGGSAYLLNLSTAPTYNTDGSLKIIKQAYVSDPTKYYEQRFEYTAGLASKIELKDDLSNKWVQHTNIYDVNEQLQVPVVTNITEWTII